MLLLLLHKPSKQSEHSGFCPDTSSFVQLSEKSATLSVLVLAVPFLTQVMTTTRVEIPLKNRSRFERFERFERFTSKI